MYVCVYPKWIGRKKYIILKFLCMHFISVRILTNTFCKRGILSMMENYSVPSPDVMARLLCFTFPYICGSVSLEFVFCSIDFCL